MLTITTDIAEADDDTMDVQPESNPAKQAEKPIRPKPVAKNSQRQPSRAKVPNVEDQRDPLTDKGSSAKKSNRVRKFLFFFWLWSYVN